VQIKEIIPWDEPLWDEFVRQNSKGSVYHTSTWIRIVRDAGGYKPLCLAAKEGENLLGILPLMAIRSSLTGKRLVCLPFSDACCALADNPEIALELLKKGQELLSEEKLSLLEMRGIPTGFSSKEPLETSGFSIRHHYKNYVIPLSDDAEAVKKTFHRTSVRQTINKSFRLGVTVRKKEDASDLDVFYKLYLLNRRRHGIPPQPKRFFSLILENMNEEPKALNYTAEYEGNSVAALIVLRYKGITYAKYEGVDDGYRDVLPVFALFWKTIEDAALAGCRYYDFGRTAVDNPGLNAFKSRWGTECIDLPYLFHPTEQGLSTVESSSLKYRLFTGVVKRFPLPVHRWLGEKLFWHFG
jgi:CelD/BcsL family acetyltransferase involved in cellulose biosynthesis